MLEDKDKVVLCLPISVWTCSYVKFHQQCCHTARSLSFSISTVITLRSWHCTWGKSKTHHTKWWTRGFSLSLSLSFHSIPKVPFLSLHLFFQSFDLYCWTLSFTLFLAVIISLTHTVHTSSFSLSHCLMGMFYWCTSYELSWAGDVNYKTMIGPLLHYAWKCPTGEKNGLQPATIDR